MRPSEGACSELGGLHIAPSDGVRPVAPEQWHATLRFLGPCDPDVVVDRLRARELPRVTARLGAVGLLGDRVVVASVEGLEELAEVVRGATADLGRAERHAFRGHLTLARLRRGAPEERRGLPLGRPLQAVWSPGEVEVVSSVTHPEGAVHTVLARLPLGNA